MSIAKEEVFSTLESKSEEISQNVAYNAKRPKIEKYKENEIEGVMYTYNDTVYM